MCGLAEDRVEHWLRGGATALAGETALRLSPAQDSLGVFILAPAGADARKDFSRAVLLCAAVSAHNGVWTRRRSEAAHGLVKAMVRAAFLRLRALPASCTDRLYMSVARPSPRGAEQRSRFLEMHLPFGHMVCASWYSCD